MNIIVDKPFLIGFGFNKHLFIVEPNQRELIEKIYDTIEDSKLLIAHNAKFDYHMMENGGLSIPETISLGDSMTVARLTEYADGGSSLSLASLGERYVDPTSKFAAGVIKKRMNAIERRNLSKVKKELKEEFNLKAYGHIWKAYKDRVQFIDYPEYQEMFDWLDEHYKKANYEDVYEEDRDLMTHYLADDLVIMLEYLKVALPTLSQIDPKYKMFRQENELIRVVGQMERVGIKADIEYLKESRLRVIEFKDQLYREFHELIGEELTSGQHEKIKELFQKKYDIYLEKSDIQAFSTLMKEVEGEPKKVAEYILRLRNIEKFLSTYIEGKMNRIVNGRLHTNINSNGAVTGRVSSDLQQQPKDPLLDNEGNELFHPRKVFIPDEDYYIFYLDYSQMEMRLQAHYTIVLSGGDLNLCRAFMPFHCVDEQGHEFDFEEDEHRIETDTWYQIEDNKVWEKVDLHTATTLQAFPDLKEDNPDFKSYRKYGKIANFLKNYAGGVGALMSQLDIDYDTAKALDDGYYKAFVKIRDYQRWVDRQIREFGFVENLFGRKYYFMNTDNSYKGYNYVVQGGCADLLKEKEIKIHRFLKRKKVKTKMVLPVHDELQFLVHKDELNLVPQLKAIMDNNREYIDTLPMTCDVEWTKTNWAEKVDYDG